jgi:site-specific recombinase XerD
MPVNVMATLKMPKLEEKELRPRTPDEERRLFNANSELKPGECRDKAIFMLMLSTGLRRAELLQLKDAEVNITEGFVTVWGEGRKQRPAPLVHKRAGSCSASGVLHRPERAGPWGDVFFVNQVGA